MARLRLYGPKGSSEVRRDRSVVDATDWTPDNLSAGETIGGLVADDVTLAAREWQDVRIVADFHGSPLGSESVEVEPLIAVPDPNGGAQVEHSSKVHVDSKSRWGVGSRRWARLRL